MSVFKISLVALLSKTLPKFLFNRALYKMTARKTLVLVSIVVILAVTLWVFPATADHPQQREEHHPRITTTR